MGDKSPRNNSKAKKQKASKKSQVSQRQAPSTDAKAKAG